MSTAPCPGSRAHYLLLATYDIADTCRRLRLPCAARIAAVATTAADWNDVAEELTAVSVGADRIHERNAARDAARALAKGETVLAAMCLSRDLRGVSIVEWVAEVEESRRLAQMMAVCA